MKNLYTLGFAILLFLSCQPDPKDTISTSNRPHEPWVFRSVLDLKPRVITLALHKNLWAAYTTNNGALYKVWDGTVNFSGTVFDTQHGPQPTSMGDAYFENKFDHPFSLKSNGVDLDYTYQYKGHKFQSGHAIILHELTPQNGSPIQIEEQIEYVNKGNSKRGFQRIFTPLNVPSGIQIFFKTNVNSIIVEQDIETNGTWEILNKTSKTFGKAEILALEGQLELQSDEPTEFTSFLHTKAVIENPNSPAEFDLEDSSIALGARLIAQNNCRTCHNTEKKTIGPSYRSVAKKYTDGEDNINMLVNKVRLGGTGVWGDQAMTPHPEISEADLSTMVSYILDLDDPEKTEGADGSSTIKSMNALTNVDTDKLVPGLFVRVYETSNNNDHVPTEILGHASPIMAGVMPNFDNVTGGDFKGLEEHFALFSNGLFLAEKTGNYSFRLWSDDGSLLYVNNEQVIDNDGYHGVEVREITLHLEEGYHDLRIGFFQGGGGKFLSLNFKPEDAEQWKVVPVANLFHYADDHDMLGTLSLPMSVATKIPGEKFPVAGMHPSFTRTQARPDDFTMKIGGMDFMPDGRLAVSTWEPDGGVYLLSNVASVHPSTIGVQKIAEGLAEPLGLKVVDGEIYVMQKQELTKLVDTNGDGVIDEYQTVSDDWGASANFHEFGFGLAYKDGYFYATLATAIQPGGASTQPQIQDRGKLLKINKETGERSFIAHGLRTPNGLGFGYNGDLFIADNQGDWLPSSKILHVREGDWFGSRSVDFKGTAGLTEKKPLVWLPQDEIGNSPTTPSYLNVGPYKNQMIHGEVTNGGVKRVFVEEVEGELQGAVFRFMQGIEGGVNRLVWGPDKALYVGCVGNPGNWQHVGKNWFGVERIAYNEESTFEMLAVKAKSNGIEIEFTEPLQEGDGWSPNDYNIRQWYYLPTIEYGGPKLDDQSLTVQSATVSDDRRSVFLKLNGMKANHVIYVNLKNHFISDMSHSLWSTEAWYTMNNIPKNKNGIVKVSPYKDEVNSLTATEKANGWTMLFNGDNFEGWRTFKESEVKGNRWNISNGTISLNPKNEKTGDLVTDQEYQDFELRLEWKIQNCGNSGVFWNVVEDDKYDAVYRTGPELQILDNVCHPDTRFPTHRAGDLYDMIETNQVTVNPAGQWNKIRLVSKNSQYEFWQNGYKVVAFTMHTDEWKEMVKNSKFVDMPDFGLAKKGHIAIQDHGDEVWFRNIKIKEF